MPEGFARIAEKRIDVTSCANIVLPDMSAPPVFRILDLRQDHVGLKILCRSCRYHGKRCRSSGYQHIKVANTGAVFFDDARDILRTSARKELYVDTKPLLKRCPDGFPQFTASWDADDWRPFFLRRDQSSLPFRLSVCG